MTESPIACVLNAIPPEKRGHHEHLAHQWMSAVQEIRELPQGYGFRLPAESTLIVNMAEFITLERLCCPFLAFTLELESENAALWFQLTGREGVKAFLQAEFDSAFSSFEPISRL